MKELPSLGFVEAIKLASSRLSDFSGRSRRSEFWWWMLIVMIANWVLTSFVGNLLVSTILATIIMFFGLAATARRLHDAGKSAWWVYVSYAIGIVLNFMTALSPAMNELTEKAMSGALNEKSIEKLMTNNAGEFMSYSLLGILMAIIGLVVIIMCCMDSKPAPNKYGESPKYVNE